MLRHHPDADTNSDGPASQGWTVRVLHNEAELAEASARAEEGARRLRDRLDARAARDQWTASHLEDDDAGWLRSDDGARRRPGRVAAGSPVTHRILDQRRHPAA